MSKLFLLSHLASNTLKQSLKQFGTVIELKPNKSLMEAEAAHCDMQICKTGECSAVVAPGIDENAVNELRLNGIDIIYGKTVLQKNYPQNIAYNVLHSSKILFHNIKYTDDVLSLEFERQGLKKVNVKQGYSGCSSIFAGDTLITSDNGIYKAAIENDIDTILFDKPNDICLQGFKNGLFGGCCGYDSEIGLIINCAEKHLPAKLKQDLECKGIKYMCLGDDKLIDIGGIIVFTGH